ncbi:hypothetical protein Cgig2_023949 [Carnegiea gigantea]|uniref:Uncharacterized protein n=1 Tax=Carnegiea gigantea TaxID=171969 RepID=A0A9Q1KC28_9CARY|nr:hypothetical protein Cgig2_023949 [Carnegiea gigantea]
MEKKDQRNGKYKTIHAVFELAFVANRKNTDEHIMLFAWSHADGQVSVVHIERDKLIPRVEYQESGEENLVLGLCIDKTSVYENVNVDLGDQEQKELPSRCLLICLTLEGKLIVFNVASIAGSQNSNIPSSGLSTDAQRIPAVEPSTLREASSTSETPQKSAMTSGSHALDANKINFRFNGISAGKDLNSSDVKKYYISTPDSCENWRTESAVENVEEKALVDAKSCKAGQLGYSSKANLSLFSLKDSRVESPSSVAGDGGGTELLRTGDDQSLVKKLPDFGKSEVEKTGTVVSQSTPNSWSTSSRATSGMSNGKSPFVSPSASRSGLSGSVLTSMDNSYNAVNFMGKVSSRPSDTCSPSIGKAANNAQKALVSGGFVDDTLGTSTSKMQSRDSVPLQSPIVNTRYTMTGNYIKSFPPGRLKSEQESSKQYCNVITSPVFTFSCLIFLSLIFWSLMFIYTFPDPNSSRITPICCVFFFNEEVIAIPVVIIVFTPPQKGFLLIITINISPF